MYWHLYGGKGEVVLMPCAPEIAEILDGDVNTGFVLSGFGCGEDAAGRSEHLQAAVGELPDQLPRMLVGPAGSPEEVCRSWLYYAFCTNGFIILSNVSIVLWFYVQNVKPRKGGISSDFFVLGLFSPPWLRV